jgi:hypothetical protein
VAAAIADEPLVSSDADLLQRQNKAEQAKDSQALGWRELVQTGERGPYIVHIDVAPVSNGDCLRSQAEKREGISVR